MGISLVVRFPSSLCGDHVLKLYHYGGACLIPYVYQSFDVKITCILYSQCLDIFSSSKRDNVPFMGLSEIGSPVTSKKKKKEKNHRPIIFLYEDQISPTVYMSINSDVYWRIITYFSLRLFWLRLINLYVITHRWVFLPAADQKTFRIQCRHFRKTH